MRRIKAMNLMDIGDEDDVAILKREENLKSSK